MGAAAGRLADHIVLTDDNPRGENPSKIIADICTTVTDHPDVRIEHDRASAIREAVLEAGPDDIVLVAGKGHETWQYLAGEKREFRDCAVIEEVLGGQA
jgi:UDP-N-acetylmuramoyl-L-alanyl-D-glutamate--2,6-diaminopimelate ligase